MDSTAARGSDRIAESDWIRGYKEGYRLGVLNGIQDVRALLPPAIRPPGYGTRVFNTPYRQGYLSGYTDGYLRAFSHSYYPYYPHNR